MGTELSVPILAFKLQPLWPIFSFSPIFFSKVRQERQAHCVEAGLKIEEWYTCVRNGTKELRWKL
jgi:hypothetical protein